MGSYKMKPYRGMIIYLNATRWEGSGEQPSVDIAVMIEGFDGNHSGKDSFGSNLFGKVIESDNLNMYDIGHPFDLQWNVDKAEAEWTYTWDPRNSGHQDFYDDIHEIYWDKVKFKMKQVIVLRKDLKMRKGKMIAQGAHASLGATLDNLEDDRVKLWLSQPFTKVALSVDSERELLDVYKLARESGLISALITDSGLTEFHGVPTNTCIAIGPDYEDIINKITGKLKLL